MYCTSRVRIVQSLAAAVCVLLLAGCGGGSTPQTAKVKDNFDKVKEGMTSAEVVNLLGPAAEGVPGMPNAAATPDVKAWEEGDTVYVVMFLNDKVRAKESRPKQQAKAADPQDKTRPAAGSRVTRENYDKIKAGMSRKEVEAILGRGRVVKVTKIGGVTGEKVFWQDGKKLIQVLFEDDKVIAMIPKGL